MQNFKKNKIRKLFNHAAPTYDAHACAQFTIGEKLLKLISAYTFSSPRIIDLGCGTGFITQKLLHQFKHADCHAVDIADQLLESARKRLDAKIYEADFDDLPPYDHQFDIIFSNMALQWSSNLISSFNKISLLSNANGLLAFSIPLPGTFTELAPHFAINPFFTANLINEILECCGYDVAINTNESLRIPFPDTLSALRYIKKIGANFVLENNSHYLGAEFIKKNPITELTYHIGYFVAIKKEMTTNEIIHHRHRHRMRQNLRQRAIVTSI